MRILLIVNLFQRAQIWVVKTHDSQPRSSLSNWSVGSQEAALQDVDYISFLFSTMMGFSTDKLAILQEAGDDCALSPSPLSPLSLYPTPLDQFTHHWDVVEVRRLIFVSYSKIHVLYLLTKAAAGQKC